MSMLDQLNPEQREAVTHGDGPLLILAGAGSGKTKTLVHRIAHLIQTGRAHPSHIFAVTFTNKAAGEMRARLSTMLGRAIDGAWIGTFHALCARLLRDEGSRVGLHPSFTIFDESASKRLLRAVVEEMRFDTTRGASVTAIADAIERAKNLGFTADALLASQTLAVLDRRPGLDLALAAAAKVYPRYQDALRRSNAVDFGDLILLTVQLLESDDFRGKLADRFRHVLCDEYQDIDAAQGRLLRLLACHENITVVGDDSQAVYGFRGADPRFILEFTDHHPAARVVTLERNYRSTANILAAANAVISKTPQRYPKTLRTEADAGAKVGVSIVETGTDEAELVAQTIADRIIAGERASSFAILYRQNAQSRPFEDALRRRGIEHSLLGGPAFYDRDEVKDVLAYLRAIANPSSRPDFERILDTPTRGLGDNAIGAMRTACLPFNVDGSAMLEQEAALRSAFKPSLVAKLHQVRDLLRDLRKLAETASAAAVATAVIERTDYVRYIQRIDPRRTEDRLGNLAELIAAIAEQEAKHPREPEKTPLAAFLDRISLVAFDDQLSDGAVTLLTLHGAKGLEFDVVFMVGMEEETFPSKQAISAGAEEIEEERRLCYVGMTRARKELHLIAARSRYMYGHEETRMPSRFLADIPPGVTGSGFGGFT
jgi:DNA helicase II / ATP-dependent DNA helicase PcrA